MAIIYPLFEQDFEFLRCFTTPVSVTFWSIYLIYVCYVSALDYCHRLAGYSDPTKEFWVLEMLKGYTKMGMRVDTRLLITLPILLSIVDNIPSLCSTLYESRLYQAMCTTTFFAFLRVGEITICPRSRFVLQIEGWDGESMSPSIFGLGGKNI